MLDELGQRRAIHLRHAGPLLAAGDERREGLPLRIAAGGPLQRVHRLAKLLEIAEPLPPVARHRDPHQVRERPRQLRTRTFARVGSGLAGEQLVSQRPGGIDLHARLRLGRSAALEKLGREVALLVVGALLVEARQLYRAGRIQVHEPRAHRRFLPGREARDRGEEPQRLARRQLLPGRARALEDVVQRDQAGAQPPVKSVSQRFGRIGISPARVCCAHLLRGAPWCVRDALRR